MPYGSGPNRTSSLCISLNGTRCRKNAPSTTEPLNYRSKSGKLPPVENVELNHSLRNKPDQSIDATTGSHSYVKLRDKYSKPILAMYFANSLIRVVRRWLRALTATGTTQIVSERILLRQFQLDKLNTQIVQEKTSRRSYGSGPNRTGTFCMN
ncbi:hypothetical protein B0H19DRAFT_1073379 [Mycena capillaripes]|nr:hypothetical protein B0H19DRAFT_1073379 [Mycena capillaripes]